jgi:hypothetical protein
VPAEVSPAVSTPVPAAVTPQASEPQAPALPAASSSEPAPAAPEAPAEPAPPVEPALKTSLLSETDKPPVDGTPDEPEAKPEAAPELPPITYEAFKLPDGVKFDDAEVGKYTTILGKYQVPQEAAQQLMDLYVQEHQRSQTLNQETWNRTRENWINAFKSDDEIGGNRVNTTLGRCRAVIDRYAGVAGPERAQTLRDVFSATGAGDHPEVIRFINWIAGRTTEQARVVPATVPKAPQPGSRATRRYQNTNGAA